MKKKRGSWLAGAATAALFLLLIIFSLAGDHIYNRITPRVTVLRLRGQSVWEGRKCIQVPDEALTDEKELYIVTSEQGFSRTVYQIWKKEVEYIEDPGDSSKILIFTKLPANCSMVVSRPESAQGLADGDQVLPQK